MLLFCSVSGSSYRGGASLSFGCSVSYQEGASFSFSVCALLLGWCLSFARLVSGLLFGVGSVRGLEVGIGALFAGSDRGGFAGSYRVREV